MLNKKVLVTGGAGFIGSNLADELIAQGAEVTILDNLVTGFRENLDEIKGTFEFIEADLNDSAALKKALKGVEIVFHEAGFNGFNGMVNHSISLLIADISTQGLGRDDFNERLTHPDTRAIGRKLGRRLMLDERLKATRGFVSILA